MRSLDVGHRLDGSRRVALVTGSAGFKGQWLTRLLATTGFETVGWDKRRPEQQPGRFEQLDLIEAFELPSEIDLVFHLAAQSLVPVGYEQPAATWLNNVLPTVNLMESCRKRTTRLDVVVVTSDKVYVAPRARRPLHEDDRLGGYCPYSSSKAAAELVVGSYRSLLPECVRVITVRAGNVIGGGDDAPARLIPDVIRAAHEGRSVELRHPDSTRPWLFVLDCLWGYLMASEALRLGVDLGNALNFGPDSSTLVSAGELAGALAARLGAPPPVAVGASPFAEAQYLELDSSRARRLLEWAPLLSVHEAIEWTAEWALAPAASAERVRTAQIDRFLAAATGR